MTQTISLEKGGSVSLDKIDSNLTLVTVGLGWDERGNTSGYDYDLDASAFVLGSSGRVLSPNWFVFYNNMDSPDGSVHHHGDNLTGAGDGDDEQIDVDLSGISTDAQRVAISVTIHQASERGQNFGQVKNAYIRVFNAKTGQELARYDLGEEFSLETSVVFGELRRSSSGGWSFHAAGEPVPGGLGGVCARFGVQVG